MPRIDVNGATIDYGDTGGDKPVIVLIHGWLGTWDHEF
ncbi:MAG: alpha/beta hydrolase, partial [Chloroflexi bacterium]|nr:alpha/beta hydrolase [Chloroflexota bacterium]